MFSRSVGKTTGRARPVIRRSAPTNGGGEFAHQAFVPVSDEIIAQHLRDELCRALQRRHAEKAVVPIIDHIGSAVPALTRMAARGRGGWDPAVSAICWNDLRLLPHIAQGFEKAA